MTDRDLGLALGEAKRLEESAIAHWKATRQEDLAEKDAALVVRRHATALRISLERWAGVRATRAASVSR